MPQIKPQNPKPMLCPKEWAYEKSVSVTTALRLARAGQIKGAEKVGKQWRMPASPQL